MSVQPSLSIAIHMDNLQNDGTGGEGPKVLLPIGDIIGREIEITPMTVDEFCAKYDLGDDILHRLNNEKVESDNIGALITAKNLMSPEYGLKLGHVAEVKWALKLFLLSCRGIKEVELPVRGTTGGEGGHGEKQGEEGGMGQSPVFTLKDAQRFCTISAGQGGQGGDAGAPPPAETKKDGAIGGGAGGVGSQVGGDGGTGNAPVIPLEAVGTFQWMQGEKGTDGPGVEIGGKGGPGKRPKFPKPLVEIEQAHRHRVHANNVRLKEGKGVSPKLREFNVQLNEKLIDRLHELGFQTVGGLFEIYDADLDKEPFEAGNKESLKFALEQFLIRSK
ncbi:hypothetical protein B0H19DRAFT_1124017 [Mycena capillaripes]|nr:hypothetical protein B0H19DRAFT_1124017 [Mycena capillaripes]